MVLEEMSTVENLDRTWPTVDFVDPSQNLSVFHRQKYTEPERKLMVAVLENALRCLEKHISAADRRGQELCREAEEWLFTDAGEGIFSFSGVCQALELNPAYIRNHLLAWKERSLRRLRASRRRRRARSPIRRIAIWDKRTKFV